MLTTTAPSSLATKYGTQRSKRPHKKSRDSCGSCRRRRVRCTLERPTCKACTRLNLSCEYRISRMDIEVYRLGGGQTFIVPATSKALLPAHFETSKISFWILNTLPLISNVGPPPDINKKEVVPSLFINKDGRSVFDNGFHIFDRMWRLLTLPLAYNEKGIFDMLALLGQQHQLALQRDGYQQAFDTQSYAQILCIVASIARRCSPDVVLAAISTLYAYERIASAATATDPPDRFSIHGRAITSIYTQSEANESVRSYFVGPLSFSLSLQKFFLDRNRAFSIDVGNLAIPGEFEDLYEARDCFFEILRTHDNNDVTRKYMTCWGIAMRRLFHKSRVEDWNKARQALTLLAQFELLRAAFESSTQPINIKRVEEISP